VIIAYADGFDFAVVARANGTAGVSGIVFWSRCFCDPDAHQHDFDDAVCSIQERIPDVKILAGDSDFGKIWSTEAAAVSKKHDAQTQRAWRIENGCQIETGNRRIAPPSRRAPRADEVQPDENPSGAFGHFGREVAP
jgi:hypothetical protein